ncbi:MAG TPA: adenosine deaminase family protein [Planctomycetota bacterium]|nr:adenosine deaminase family protein [Planctomycetota bacterium]
MIDLHRHFEGSIRPATAVEMAQRNGDLPTDVPAANLTDHFLINPSGTREFGYFLAFFLKLRKLIRSAADVERLVSEVLEDAHAEGITHLDLRFSPQFLTAAGGGPVEELATVFLNTADACAGRLRMAVAYIVTLNRDYGLDGNRGSLTMLERPEFARRIAGVDVAGTEGQYSIEPFRPFLEQALADGLFLTLHAGEAGGPENVREAVEWGATRIGHGIHVVQSPAVVEFARSRGVVFEVCPQSNLLTGVVPDASHHPLAKMLAAGLNVTINSDDPGLMGTTLRSEFAFCRHDLGIPDAQLQRCRDVALKTFLAHGLPVPAPKPAL